jgi:NAD(P)-dependent dehydrogenase (short-subunit alcohol dehydrogenase family)
MQDLKGKTAVITGAASGFGRELAILCAQEGMQLVLADVDENGLATTVEDHLPAGTKVLQVKCNVADAGDVERLAIQAVQRFGAAHLLFNNAGVAVAGPAWSATLEDWKWVLDVNLMGVVNGIRSFVPRMLKQNDECHVVNTASVAGLLSVPGSAVYCVSKHGVVTLSECLQHDLRMAQAKIGVSVLCPAFVNTGIAEAVRNRPAELSATNPLAGPYEARVKQAVRSGRLSAADVARITMEAVKEGRFYILTHPKIKASIEARMQDILQERLPTNPMP